ncbi:fungal specific transcription factor domain-containing protein [Aspergillus lucknowensis]|uniref:Transcription factor domain-containing protein n=1 Tax=Aspergillus lucknowensis TaxID=176173 RepID=A0ABR4M1S2_9EURO
MGCHASRETPSSSTETEPKHQDSEADWQNPQQTAPAPVDPYNSRFLSTSVKTNSAASPLKRVNSPIPPSAGAYTAKTLPAFSFLNGGVMGTPGATVLGSSKTASDVTRHTYLNTTSIRAYGCERDLINAYYIYIHPYLPLLPPPAFPQYEDCPTEITPLSPQADRSALPFWPTSPFTLAASALLVLIPLAKDPDPRSEPATALRRSFAQLFVRSAEQALETSTDNRRSNMPTYPSSYTFRSSSTLHPDTPASLEPILSLLLLSVYDYCQRGSKRHMRSRAHQALAAAMDLSLHALGPDASDAQRRAWWMTMYLASQSSISNHSAPIMLTDDPRISTPYPEFRRRREPWEVLMEAQHVLVRAGSVAKELAKKRSRTNLSRATADEIRRLDSAVLTLGMKLDTAEYATSHEGSEASAARNLRLIAMLSVHTARILIHRFIAFGNSPLPLEKHCDLRAAPTPSPSQAWTLDVDSTYPFTVPESTDICLRSALVLSRTIRHLRPPNPHYFEPPPISLASTESATLRAFANPQPRPQYPRSLPYLSCCTMQSCYVLAMLLCRLRACLHNRDLSPCYYLLRCVQPGTEVQDAERAIEELQNGVGSLYASLKADSVFEGVVDMVRDVETIYAMECSRGDICTVPAVPDVRS